ncbi:hypothetical protein Tco_0065977 [Tanacetum coccineum]
MPKLIIAIHLLFASFESITAIEMLGEGVKEGEGNPTHSSISAHGFSELHQLSTFYNSLNSNDQDALDSAAGGNFLDKMPQEGLAIIESKSKVRYSRSRASDSRTILSHIRPDVSTSSPTLTPFDESDFLLFEEADAFIAIDDEPVSPVFNATYYDPRVTFSQLSWHFHIDPFTSLQNQKITHPEFKRS